MSEKRKALVKLIQRDGIVVAPGVYDGIGARLTEAAGFEAAYLTGFGCSGSLLGLPDSGFLTLTELATHARNIDGAIGIPLVADCESGFGNALNAARAVREYEKAGVAALHIEDQMIPRACRPDGKPHTVPMEEHVGKIRAAADARTEPDMLIIGRTDALGRYGLREAINRANAYRDAGCDMVFIHGPQTVEELETIAREVTAPQVVNYSTMIESGNQPILTVQDLEDMGFKLVVFPSILVFTAVGIMRDALAEFRETGGLTRHLERMVSIADYKKVMEWDTFAEKEREYLP